MLKKILILVLSFSFYIFPAELAMCEDLGVSILADNIDANTDYKDIKSFAKTFIETYDSTDNVVFQNSLIKIANNLFKRVPSLRDYSAGQQLNNIELLRFLSGQ